VDRTATATGLNPSTSLATPAATDAGEHRRWIVIIASGVFATTLAQPGLLRLPFQHILKTELALGDIVGASLIELRRVPATLLDRRESA
jgi:uncharacterized membrane protein (DUF441 family)